MKSLFTKASRTVRARRTLRAARLRLLGTILVCSIGSSLLSQGQVLAQKAAATGLSPLISQSTLLSPTDPTKEIGVVLVLPLKDPKGANEFALRVSTPKDELYGKYLTPQEFAARYGADEADYAAVKSWATANGLKISDESVSRTTLAVRGTVAQFEVLFRTLLNNYRSPDGDEFYSAGSKPVIPNSISSKLSAVVGLTNSKQYATLAKVYKKFGETPATKPKTDTAGGNGPGGAYDAADLRNTYSISMLSGATVSQTVAVFEQGGFAKGDVTKYLKKNNLPDVPIKVRGVNGFTGVIVSENVEVEAVLDIDMIIGINPAVKEVIAYEDGYDYFQVAILDALTDVANDNKVQTLSISYGLREIGSGEELAAEGQVLTQMAAQGINVFASSGDDGAYCGPASLNVLDPGSQPFVTCVGGTTLYTVGSTCTWLDEEVWNLLPTYGATGGGVSSYWAIPSWQSSYNPRWNGGCIANGGSATYRNVPDVAAVANPLTGVAVYSRANGGWLQIGGTSVSAPLWAGYMSLINSINNTVGLQPIGFFNPTLYGYLAYYEATYYGSFHDVVTGNNSYPLGNGFPIGYSAGPVYDNCTGFGSMSGGPLVSWLLLNNTLYNGPGQFNILSAKPTTSTIQLTWQPSSGATGYFVQVGGPGDPYLYFPIAYVAAKGTNAEITGLAPNTTYYVEVAGVNSGGYRISNGNYSIPVTTNK